MYRLHENKTDKSIKFPIQQKKLNHKFDDILPPENELLEQLQKETISDVYKNIFEQLNCPSELETRSSKEEDIEIIEKFLPEEILVWTPLQKQVLSLRLRGCPIKKNQNYAKYFFRRRGLENNKKYIER